MTKDFNKLDDAIGDAPFDWKEISTLLEVVDKKKKTISDIDEQIVNTVNSEGKQIR